MRALALLALLAGCSTITLRAGAVMIGGRPAFQATVEAGMSVGSRRLYEVTHETGMQADASGVSTVVALNADLVTLDEALGPIAKIGARLRGVIEREGMAKTTSSIGARATFYPGLLRESKTQSGGFGFELAGGIGDDEAVIEASLVLTSKSSMD